MAEQDMTLDAGKVTNSAFIPYDVLHDHEKHFFFIKNTDKVFRLAVHVLNIFVYNRSNRFTFNSISQKTYVFFSLLRWNLQVVPCFSCQVFS